ncbi:SpoIID/LytB domain-containing protein [Oscillatoria sp. CS-180]|uniref:SpoIID/LytB domain-containing protein n=1 Tax=Oscillatoria sp. CS-180 TaxID=3021720 RepID=UPI0023301468|nr:SpoIID/LytB domain-containing protein [Oscillatoria sp. CS-180]MDB9524901.1 SpoIID/LytB domain-containing protein [Oscillatoria sp. CS-180]
MPLVLKHVVTAASVAISASFLWPAGSQAQAPQNPILQIGIVQRFGRDDTKTLVIEPLGGDQLTVQFKTGDELETVTTNQIVLDTTPTPLEGAALQERVVLSTHRSFESAEDSANQWRQQGIETEIAQPDDWQVWAKRDVYSTPLLRRMLHKDLQAAGYDEVYIDSRVLQDLPKSAAIFNGFRYNRDIFSITTASQRVRVIEKVGNVEETVRVYGGNLRLQPNAYGSYTLVNKVPIETYLRGVVPYEIGLGAPPTTIEAQAILARTYVLRNLRRFEIDDYELCADTQCQVYRGITGAADVTDRAIAATQGQVLTYENELVDALYSSNAGGVTAAFSHVWNGPDRPYLRPVVDSVAGSWNIAQRPLNDEANLKAFLALETGFNEETWDTFRWQEDASLEDIGQDLKEYLQARSHPLANFTEVQRLVVTERAESGRVQILQIATDAGVVTLEKDEVIRAIAAPLSLLFYTAGLYEQPPGATEPELTGYRFIGGGFGHGVGMSQTGAYNLGDLGWSSERIVKFYYPGTELQPISDELILWKDPYEIDVPLQPAEEPES